MKSRGQEQGIWGWGRGARDWRLLTAIILTVAAATSFASHATARERESDLGIAVRVYNYAEVSPATLRKSEKEASRIFREAGIETVWLDCPTSVAKAADCPACEPPLGALGVDLRILSKSMALRVRTGREQLGFALESQRPGSASAAWVFYHRVEQLAESKDVDQGQVLGHAIAHEIGHLLLGPDSHSNRGIMRANWDRKYLQDAAQGHLWFTPDQAKLIRTDVQARIAMSEASVTRQPVGHN